MFVGSLLLNPPVILLVNLEEKMRGLTQFFKCRSKTELTAHLIHFTKLLNSLNFRVSLVHLLAKGNVILEPTSLEWLQWSILVISPLEIFSAYLVDSLCIL